MAEQLIRQFGIPPLPSNFPPPSPLSQLEMGDSILGKVTRGKNYHTRHTVAGAHANGDYTGSKFANSPVSSTISRDAAEGNAAKENSILFEMAKRVNIENSPHISKKSIHDQTLGIPPLPANVDTGSHPPPPPPIIDVLEGLP